MIRASIFLIGAMSLSLAAQSQVYVSAAGDNSTGASWATALNDIAAGVSTATSQTTDVWIAAGTYVVSGAITVPSGMGIYGGFPSTGNPGFGSRDTDANPSILDGQLDFHIFQCSNVTDVVIDGVQFTQAESDIGAGGAIRVVSNSDVTINDCRFFDNTALQYGPGVYIDNANADIAACVFTNNVGAEAGAVMLFNGTATITDCVFDGNDGGGQGGAILAYQQPVTISRCVFDGNTGARGGAVAIREGTGSRIENTLFVNNTASNHGAGVNLETQQDIEIVNCTFVDNTASTRGGGVFFHDSDGFVTNCIFVNNNNRAIYENSVTADPLVRNNLFFNNPDGVYYDESATSLASAAALNASVAEASNNIDGDPVFVNASGGDYHIDVSSPARNAGILAGAPSVDFEGEIRDALVDLGFDEVEPGLPIGLPVVTGCILMALGASLLFRRARSSAGA